MSYAYNVLLNFQKNFYDFFEWNIKDKIVHLKKIPLLKVSNHDYQLLKYACVKFKKNFLLQILNKATTVSKIKNLNYVFIISNGKEAMGLKLNKTGINTFKSSLSIDEEEDVVNIIRNLDCIKLDYDILKHKNKEIFKTRNELEIEKQIARKITHLYKKNEYEKLKYLYLECFNRQETNINKIYKSLMKGIANEKIKLDIVGDFFKIIKQK